MDHLEKIEHGLPRKRESPCPGNRAACEHGLDRGLIAELHTDVHRVGDDRDAAAMSQRASNCVVMVPAIRPIVSFSKDRSRRWRTDLHERMRMNYCK